MMLYSEYTPAYPLNKYIDCIWFHRCDEKSFSGRTHLVVPDNTVELIISRHLIRRSFLHKGESHVCTTHLCGIKTVPQLVTFSAADMTGIRFKPYGLYRFINGSVAGTVDQVVDPCDLFGQDFTSLADQVLACGQTQEKVKLVEKYLLKKLRKRNAAEDDILNLAISQVLVKKGMFQVSDFSKELSISVKTIERKFMAKVGMTPKKYARLIRFRQVLDDYFIHDHKKLSEIAYNNGYFDQTHFIKETTSFTGSTPGKYFFPNSGNENLQVMMLRHRNTAG